MKYLVVILMTAVITQAGVIHPHLAEKLEVLQEDESIAAIVHMKAQADLLILPRGTPKAEKIQYLMDFAEQHQADLINYLESLGNQVIINQTWWIFDGLMFTSTREIIERVAARADVDFVIDDFVIQLDTKVVETRTPGWNIDKVDAELCWDDGYTGAGVIVGNMDTGVDVSHAAFGGRWVPGGWYDAVNGQPNPYDDHGHGTHTMGTLCGGDGNGPFTDDIGVAPGATFIAAKCFNSGGSGQSSWIHNAFSWFAGQDATVCSNSWGSSSTTSTAFWNDCINLRNMDIYPVFSIGNTGPYPGSAGTPGNFPIVTGVGSTNSSDNLASSSGRGPAPNQSPWNSPSNWGRPDWNLTKPDISAPGVSVRSSVPGGGYGYMSGTSMACPHVAGAVALCLEKNAALDYFAIYNYILDEADEPPQGAPYPNNNYGWGRLNCYSTLTAVPVGVEEVESPQPITELGFSLTPNPVASYLTLNLQIPVRNSINVNIYNVAGRFIRTLASNRSLDYGNHNLTWNLRDVNNKTVANGVYFVMLETTTDRISKKIVVAR